MLLSCMQLLGEQVLLNLYIVTTASPPSFTVPAMIASVFPTISAISILSRDPYFCSKMLPAEHHSQVNSLSPS